jgi:hypothetical protein
MIDLDALLKRFAHGDIAEEVARENFEYNKSMLFQRLEQIERLCEMVDWNERKYVSYHAELLAYLAEGRKLV